MTQDTGILNPLYKILLELGLTSLEAQLYMLSLSLGPSLVTRLSKHLEVSRPNTYKVIAGLEKHGLAHFSERKSYGKRFIVESPSKVIELLRNKQRQLNTYDQQIVPLMPELIATYKQGELPAKVHVISNRDQLMLAFAQVFEESKDDISFMGSTEDLDELVTFARLEKHIERRVARGVMARVLVFPGHDAELLKMRDAQELRETRFIKGIEPFVTSFYLFANKVIIWQPKAPLAVLIEDKYIVEMQKSIFERLWEDSSAIERKDEIKHRTRVEKNLLLAKKVVERLREKGLYITTTESCTGGAVADCLTNIPGSSDVIEDSFVVYSNKAKIAMGVPEHILSKYSVYSKESAIALANAGLMKSVHADVGVGITGSISRADPRNKSSVPGVVHIAVKYKDKILDKELNIKSADRSEAKQQIVEEVLISLLKITLDF